MNHVIVKVDCIKVYVVYQKWNHDECQCECKELNEWGSCINYYI